MIVINLLKTKSKGIVVFIALIVLFSFSVYNLVGVIKDESKSYKTDNISAAKADSFEKSPTGESENENENKSRPEKSVEIIYKPAIVSNNNLTDTEISSIKSTVTDNDINISKAVIEKRLYYLDITKFEINVDYNEKLIIVRLPRAPSIFCNYC